MRATLLAILLAACDPDVPSDTDIDSETASDSDSETETGSDSETDTNTEPRRNQAQRCEHEGHLDAWFPRTFTQVHIDRDDGPRDWPFAVESDEHEAWWIAEDNNLEIWWYGSRKAKMQWGTWGIPDEGAERQNRPDAWSSQRDVVLTQNGDALQILGDRYHWECTRRVRPTSGVNPSQQVELWCVDKDGVGSLWLDLMFFSEDVIPEHCLADHEPELPMPTRWSAMFRTTESGTTQYPHSDEAGQSSPEELVLHNFSEGSYVREFISPGFDGGITYDGRVDLPITWTETEPGKAWAFEYGETSLECVRDDGIGEYGDDIRTFAMACEDQDGVQTWWVPMDMTYPWGWGSHDTPGGWWWRP